MHPFGESWFVVGGISKWIVVNVKRKTRCCKYVRVCNSIDPWMFWIDRLMSLLCLVLIHSHVLNSHKTAVANKGCSSLIGMIQSLEFFPGGVIMGAFYWNKELWSMENGNANTVVKCWRTFGECFFVNVEQHFGSSLLHNYSKTLWLSLMMKMMRKS